MARLRRNFTSGTITDNPLTSGATTINSANFANLPAVVSPDIIALVLDPLGTAGVPEIVYVTAHTASATSVTVSRGQETSLGGSAARQHLQNIPWILADTAYEQSLRLNPPRLSCFSQHHAVDTSDDANAAELQQRNVRHRRYARHRDEQHPAYD